MKLPIQLTIGLPVKEERFGKPAETMRDVRSAIEIMHEYTVRYYDPEWDGASRSNKVIIYEEIAESGDPVKARERLVNNMRGSYLLMLDADTMPDQDTLVKLLEADKDIISCPMVTTVYPNFLNVFRQRGDTWDFQPWVLDDDYTRADVLNGRIMECDAHGFGMILFKREVFDNVPPPWFSRMQHKIWPCMTYGHDVSFSIRAREAGLKIYTPLGTAVKHATVGWLDYSAHLQAIDNDEMLRRSLKEWDNIQEVVIAD